MYFMPRIRPDLNICGPVDWHCYDTVKDAIDLGYNDSFTCSCMPACFGINYDTEMSMARMLENNQAIREKMLRGMTAADRRNNIAVLQVFYKEANFRSQNKEELIGFTEFLCECDHNFCHLSSRLTTHPLEFCSFQPTPVVFWAFSWASA